jgi:hypothetical protein
MNNKNGKTLLVVLLLACTVMVPFDVHAKTTTDTYHLEDVTETLNAWNTCLGGFQGTLNYDALIHKTENKNGYHSIIVMNGTAFVEPFDPQYPSFTSEINETIVEHTTKNQDFMVQVITTIGDGLEFHITFKVSYNDQGPTIEVFNTACGN